MPPETQSPVVGTEPGNTRQAILQASHDLFLQQGYHGTSMRQIAQEAGIALGGIYNHFASKEELFIQVLLAYHPIHEVLPAIAQSESKNPEAFVHDAAQTISRILQARPGFLNLMFIEMVEFGSQHLPLIYESFFPLGLQAAQRFAEKQSRLREFPVAIMLRAFLGLIFSLTLTRVMLAGRGEAVGDPQEVQQFAEIFLHGIMK
ncbi:MAG: TetR/AcrR family transcriptional regulator [Anaerolineales bacterium]|jgi:AcrR family transcriptional regulator